MHFSYYYLRAYKLKLDVMTGNTTLKDQALPPASEPSVGKSERIETV